jgi:N-glycosylase/DNA lyase
MPDFMLIAKDFSLKHTIESGQPLTFYSDFHPGKRMDSLSYPTERGRISLIYDSESGRIGYDFTGKYSTPSAATEITKRLGLDHDLKSIYGEICTDQFMARAIAELYGMRITGNEPWEATLCFVVSQFNNIKRIRRIILNLMNKFGEDRGAHGRLFPTPEALASADISEIRACGTGFRDRYIKHVSEQFSSSFDPERLYGLKYEDAKERLMELDGVGDKVADCILLFGYNKFEAFPIDVWVKRVVERAYFNGRKQSIRRIHDFSVERWGKYRGYAQQYIFHYGREKRMV